MAQLQKQTLDTKRSLTYTYYTSQKTVANSSNPALFFIHGFPDSALMWSEIVEELVDLPYRVIVPDVLGYAGTSKPTDIDMYKWSGQCADLLEILQREETKNVIIIGHDWGSLLAQRFYNHHPDLVSGMVLCNVSYRPPSTDTFDLDQVNLFTEKKLGYPLYKYWEFFTSDDGFQLINENLEKFWEVLHGDEDNWMGKMFAGKDAMAEYERD